MIQLPLHKIKMLNFITTNASILCSLQRFPSLCHSPVSQQTGQLMSSCYLILYQSYQLLPDCITANLPEWYSVSRSFDICAFGLRHSALKSWRACFRYPLQKVNFLLKTYKGNRLDWVLWHFSRFLKKASSNTSWYPPKPNWHMHKKTDLRLPPFIRGSAAEATGSGEKLSPILQLHLGELQTVSGEDISFLQQDLGLPQGVLIVGHSLKPFKGRCPGGLLIKYSNYLSWLLLLQRSFCSTLDE